MGKWEDFRKRKHAAIKKYYKVRKQMLIIEKIIPYQVAHFMIKKLYHNYRALVNLRIRQLRF